MHSERQALIKAKVRALLFNKALTEVLAKYSDYSNIFLVKYTAELPKNTWMNEYTIELEEDKQSLFRPIYSLNIVKLEILKTYIKTNLANGFIQLFKSSARAPILFDRKPNQNLHLFVDYWGFNNLIIKYQYQLSLMDELFDWLGQVK